MTPHKATRFAWDREDEGWYPMGYVLGGRHDPVVERYEKAIRERMADPDNESLVLTEVTIYTGFTEDALGAMIAEAEEWNDYYDEPQFLHDPDEREIRGIVATSEMVAARDRRIRSIDAAEVRALPLRERSRLYNWEQDGDYDFDPALTPEAIIAPPGHVLLAPGQMEMKTSDGD